MLKIFVSVFIRHAVATLLLVFVDIVIEFVDLIIPQSHSIINSGRESVYIEDICVFLHEACGSNAAFSLFIL